MTENVFRDSNGKLLTLYDDLVRTVDMFPNRMASVGIRTETMERRSMTYRELKKAVDQLAAGLSNIGVRPGDIVSVQLPNFIEFPVIVYAVFKLGAVFNGIPSIYRQREVEFILRRTKSKVYIIPSMFRGFDHLAMAHEMKSRISSLETIITVDDLPSKRPYLVSMSSLMNDMPYKSPVQLPPDMLAQIAFTSGTTGEPKGVMHTHKTLRDTVVRFVEHVHPPSEFVNLVVSPVGHQTGFLWGTLLTVHQGGTAVYLDVWNPAQAWSVIEREQVTTMIAAAPFLRDLVQSAEHVGVDTSTLAMICIPGAPIPRSLVPYAARKLRCRIIPAWGMTEYGIAIAVEWSSPPEAYETDGRALPGADVRVVDSQGKEAAPDEEGELQVKGEGLFKGYYKRKDLTDESFVDGWFKTGDRAVKNSAGFIKITGRSKDIIVRGGENIPVQDVEDLLLEWPLIQDVAIVAMKDDRLGERACAYVVPSPGQSPTLEKMREYLAARQLTKQFWPERLECVEQLPRTASGKIQKYVLREDVQKKVQIERPSNG